MLTSDLFKKVLLEPADQGCDELYIVSGYGTPAMAFHHLEALKNKGAEVSIKLILGMCARDGLGQSHHLGFKQLVENDFKARLECSYLTTRPPVHSKVYGWFKNGRPAAGFAGSPNYTQVAFSGNQREFIAECSATDCRAYFDSLVSDTIYCDHIDAENLITIFNDKEFYSRQRRRRVIEDVEPEAPDVSIEGLPQVTISLLDSKGKLPARSGLNWGQRPEYNREPNQAYIRVPSEVAKTDFFPPKGEHFTVVTDDGKVLVCTRAQDNAKAIETPHNNSLIGVYFRGRLGLASGQLITVDDLKRYGRTNVTFTKIDDETYRMDFS
jgi:hypothetical protein